MGAYLWVLNMTKAEIIERYGIEWYNKHNKEYQRKRQEELRKDQEYRKQKVNYTLERRKDPEYAKYSNELQIKYHKRRICNEYWNIENYELAKADNFEGWVIHHRLELHPDGSLRYTRKSLIKLDLYYNRPSNELIWLRIDDHLRMHNRKGSK